MTPEHKNGCSITRASADRPHAGHWRSLLVGAMVVVSVLLGDARPGWCPFLEPTPGGGIHVPKTISPGQAALSHPSVAIYPVFDRPRVVDKGPRPARSGPGPAMVPASGRPNSLGATIAGGSEPTYWMANPLWTMSACLLIALIGLLPLLWMYCGARAKELPAEIRALSWRGWTERPDARRKPRDR